MRTPTSGRLSLGGAIGSAAGRNVTPPLGGFAYVLLTVRDPKRKPSGVALRPLVHLGSENGSRPRSPTRDRTRPAARPGLAAHGGSGRLQGRYRRVHVPGLLRARSRERVASSADALPDRQRRAAFLALVAGRVVRRDAEGQLPLHARRRPGQRVAVHVPLQRRPAARATAAPAPSTISSPAAVQASR